MQKFLSRVQLSILLLTGLLSSSSITAHGASATVVVGRPVTLSVTAEGTAPFTYQWRKDGTNLAGATGATYAISSFQTASAGAYSTVVTNSVGSTISDNASLTADATTAPVITTQPVSRTVTAGAAVTFTVVASGSPAPTYQWRKDGVAISGATGASYTIATTVAANAGTYTVMATNSAGSATSSGALLTVNLVLIAPAITTQPASQSVSTGGSITFTAAASGYPAPTYQWQKNGANISGATGALYTISGATAASAGTYRVIATNLEGAATSNGAVLTVTAAATTVSIWPGATVPVLADGGPDSPVTLGVKFKSDVAGAITGVRFYKSTGNTGTHIGSLWSSAGTLLATAAFSSETGSGWQQVNFAAPVTIAANTVYVVSYFCPAGHYSADTGYFAAKGADNAPLHALASGVSGLNGLYSYASSSVFPNQTWNAANYWVDVVFQPSVAVTLTALAVTPSSPAVPVGATQQFAATATYSNATTQNVTSQVTWSSSNPAVASINATTGLATTAAAGASTISATLSGVTSGTTLTVQAATLVISSAPLADGLTGSTYSATLAATGGTGPYSWVIASGTLPAGVTLGATTGALTGIPTTTGTSSFTVRVTDAGNPVQVVTKAVTLTINGVPAITTQPASQTVTAGAAVIFSATATGTPTPTYQWRKDGVAISGATSASYTIASTVAANAGTYTVVATNSVGSATSSGAVLTVNPLTVVPAITTQPVSRTVTVGASVTFSAAASGTPAPTYQWRKDGVAISGATSASYTIASTVAANAGTYTVVATNSVGSATSSGAVLTVNPLTVAPAITTQPVSRTVTAGASVTFSAAASGTPAPSYQWRKNGTAISGATAASYTIASVTTASAGTYTVVASNSAGSATSSGAVLTVNSMPVFTTQPASQTVVADASVTFTAVASGTPVPTYQWRKDGVAISGATAASYTIAKAVAASAGTYTVVATNPVGSVTSSGAVLTVNSTPVITTQPATQTVTKNSNVTFTVKASGAATLTYQWRKNGSRIRNATGSSYTITTVGSSDAATYTVVISNSYGSVTSSGAVLGVKSSTAPAVIRVDFNGDGKSDILWQNNVTGECTVWLMAGTSRASVVSLGSFSLDWQPAGTGDFNGDGKSDILWQNNVTGERSIWLMAGTSVTSVISLGAAGLDWRMSGSGDFNGDGKSDILWQNNVTGERSIWLMAGTSVTSVVSLGEVDPDWQFSGAGDFNMDGQSDILLQNIATGECSVWLMAGTSIGSVVSIATPALEWQVSGSGDFNADGRSEILLQNVLTGEGRIWLMTGTSVSSVASLGTVATAWVIRN